MSLVFARVHLIRLIPGSSEGWRLTMGFPRQLISKHVRIGARVLSAVALGVAAGCQSSPPAAVRHTVPPSVSVPRTVERLAVLHQTPTDRDQRDAYSRLEGAAFQLKELRPDIRIFDRANLQRILSEQQFQFSGPVAEETAVRAGRILGVDSVLLYEIRGPSARDRLFARDSSEIPPLSVSSKIIQVENGEVVFHNVVTAAVDESDAGGGGFGSEFAAAPLIRSALARGVDRTIADLRQAFR